MGDGGNAGEAAGGGVDGGGAGTAGGPDDGSAGEEHVDDERWLVVNGRRWRRTDPSLPAGMVERLKSHLGRGRSGVGTAKRRGDDSAVAASRKRVGLAKHGLGERGPRWWEESEAARLERARQALEELDGLDGAAPEGA
ncbi:biopolymer transporter Tol [Pseudoclavibacter terrae]|uniref:biopolymer transporter Tol n=1 Tax=Pseudoclavibacter terrae TaxID=1530195 RepID=UPI003CC6E5C1